MNRQQEKCPSQLQLKEFHGGRVDQSSCDWIGEHLFKCPSCLQEVETLEARLDATRCDEPDKQQDANSGTVSGVASAKFEDNQSIQAWRHLLDEAELTQLRESALKMAPQEWSNTGSTDSSNHKCQDSFELLLNRALKDDTRISSAIVEEMGGNTKSVGDYLVVRELGQGAFSRVYLAEHRSNGRRVALKVPHDDKPLKESEIDRHLDEAKKLSMLRHPTIVPIVDWGHWKQGQCFVASDWVDGLSLRERIQHGETDRKELLSILRQIVDGLQHAHQRGLVHRDVKPDNILVNRDGKAFLIDFGLAIRDSEQWQLRGQLAGTPPYMSPEQLRGETHRLDGRTDIWSIGVILYELLAGQRPFHGHEIAQLIDEIEERDPKPLRQIDESVPAELERICLKCLQKRMTDRYATAADLSADLIRFIKTRQTQADSQTTKHLDEVSQTVCPPGVRSFEMSDARVFCALVPGLRRADGTPETIHFVSDKLSSRDHDQTFPVGVIYGPSGCGKSSFVKAGVLPLLDPSTHVVLLEATKHNFETRLCDALRAALSDVAPSFDCSQLALPELFDGIRRYFVPKKKKLVLIVDQLEQWLSVWDGKPSTPFASALRHCDGGALQTLLVVRDDFWLATSRLMQSLERPMIDGENALFIDLFLARHAEGVLQGFGRAYRALPAYPAPINEGQRTFLSQVIDGLSCNGRVAPVQVAFVAEILKDEAWEPGTLGHYGGIEGIGVRFLERTFTHPSAPAIHRNHAQAVQAVLRLLLPAPHSNMASTLKGQSRSEQELSSASGIPLESEEFQDLLHLLDVKTKLITMVDPIQRDEDLASGEERHYQLAHDYLVPSLQEWLARTEGLTWRGRTRHLMQRLNDMWSNYEDTRHLPRLVEWVQIRALIPVSEWTRSQARMMRQAQGRILRRTSIAACLIVLIGLLTWQYRGILRTNSLHESLVHAPSEDVPDLIEALDSWHRWSDPKLVEVLDAAIQDNNLKTQRRALMALVRRNKEYSSKLLEHYRSAPLDELAVMMEAVSHVSDEQCELEKFWHDLESPETPSSERMRIAILLAHRSPNDKKWQRFASEIVSLLIGQPPTEHKQWATLFRPVPQHVLPELARRIVESPDGTTLRIPSSLYNELAQGTPVGYQPIVELLESDLNVASARSNEQARRVAAAAAALAAQGRWEAVNTVFQHTEAPTLRSYLIEYLVDSVVDFDLLVDQLKLSSEPITQYGLILAIGDSGRTQSSRARTLASGALLKVWQASDSLGVRHSVSWALHEWGMAPTDLPTPTEGTAAFPSASFSKALNVNGSLGEFPVSSTNRSRPLEFPMVSFSTGNISRKDELGREVRLSIVRPFAIATTEVTVADYLRFRKHHNWNEEKSPKFNCPVNLVTWYDAVAYCNWLSEQSGIPEEQWCYLPNDAGEYAEGMTIPEDALEREGFRLATAAEWEFACRGSAQSIWSFGNDPRLASKYAWLQGNAGYRTHSVGKLKPNANGLFDMHGNVWEWCHDEFSSSEFGEPFKPGDRRLCGGTFINGPRELGFNAHNWNPPNKMTDADGFRVCRTLPIQTTIRQETEESNEQ